MSTPPPHDERGSRASGASGPTGSDDARHDRGPQGAGRSQGRGPSERSGGGTRSEPDDKLVIELNPQEQRLYDRIRARLVPARTPEAGGSGLLDLLLFLPDMVVLLWRLLRDERVPVGAKAIALLGLSYASLPIDLIPEVVFGPIGLIDDLLIVGTALSRLVNHVHPDLVRSHWPGQTDALEVIHRTTEWAHDQLVGRVRRFVRGFFPLGRD